MHGGALGPLLTRADLAGPGVTVLNLGGFANPDVLCVRRAGDVVVVKDWSRRARWVRATLAPLLARHEAAMLARADGLEGVPRFRGRIDRLALAMEWVEGRPLRRRSHARALPLAFFAALERTLDGLARRGIVYLDLASPTNVLVTPGGAPVLVDLGGALALPLPRAATRALERRALAKLRSRFAAREGEAPPPAAAPDDASAQLKVAGTRFCVREHGDAADPVPALFLAGAGLSARLFSAPLERAAARGRRALGVDLPGFGGSRREVSSFAPARLAQQLDALLDALRVGPVDVVAHGFAALVARALARRAPARVRRVLEIDAADARDDAAQLEALASRDPEALRAALAAALPEGAARDELQSAPPANLARAYLEPWPTPFGVAANARTLPLPAAFAPDTIWDALGDVL